MVVLKRLLLLLVTVPVGVALIAFAVANRHEVKISFDPMTVDAPMFSVSVPLYLALFAALIIGVMVGGAASWLGQGKWRKRARQRRYEAAKWRYEAERNRERIETEIPAAPTGLPAPRGHRDAA